jgi:hypothetical protein
LGICSSYFNIFTIHVNSSNCIIQNPFKNLLKIYLLKILINLELSQILQRDKMSFIGYKHKRKFYKQFVEYYICKNCHEIFKNQEFINDLHENTNREWL